MLEGTPEIHLRDKATEAIWPNRYTNVAAAKGARTNIARCYGKPVDSIEVVEIEVRVLRVLA